VKEFFTSSAKWRDPKWRRREPARGG